MRQDSVEVTPYLQVKKKKKNQGPMESFYNCDAHFKSVIPFAEYGVGFPISPPVSSADFNISISSMMSTSLKE